MSSSFEVETVISVKHWSERLFSIRTTRRPGLNFIDGQFIMIGLEVDERTLMRAYSIASPNYEDFLEFFSIKVPNGPLTSRLKNIAVGDKLFMSNKSTGTLVTDDLTPGKRLFLLSTGTGLAPFLSIIQNPFLYEKFEKIILMHGVRETKDLAYDQFKAATIKDNPYLGDLVKNQLLYFPCVSREPFTHQGRITDFLKNGQLFDELKIPPLDAQIDRVMICGNTSMMKDCESLLDEHGFKISPGRGERGDYVIERAFADKS